MNLVLVRPAEPMMRCSNFTLGFLYVDGKRFCFTLEDTVRVIGVKVQDKTAIPAGTYKIVMSYSSRFKRVMPELLNVPMFTGIRIHPGNTDADTSGCILVGDSISVSETKPLRDSQDAFSRLMEAFTRAFTLGHPISIEVKGTALAV